MSLNGEKRQVKGIVSKEIVHTNRQRRSLEWFICSLHGEDCLMLIFDISIVLSCQFSFITDIPSSTPG